MKYLQQCFFGQNNSACVPHKDIVGQKDKALQMVCVCVDSFNQPASQDNFVLSSVSVYIKISIQTVSLKGRRNRERGMVCV